MSTHYHAIVWIDHQEARIFEFGATDVERIVVHAHGANHHLHQKAHNRDRTAVDGDFLGRVTAALDGVGALLITGPAGAKLELRDYVTKHAPDLAKRISAVQALDHPSDTALVALARKFFKADDRMHV
jgi:stalled ribosome rescue protein Dom34